MTHIDSKTEYLEDIVNPITVQQDDIIKDMYKYSRQFPVNVIPHVTEANEINDILHNYKRAKIKEVAKDINHDNKL